MPNVLLNVRISPTLHKDIAAVSKEEGYATIQDYTREILRESIQERKRKANERELASMWGIAKNKPGVRDASKAELTAYYLSTLKKKKS